MIWLKNKLLYIQIVMHWNNRSICFKGIFPKTVCNHGIYLWSKPHYAHNVFLHKLLCHYNTTEIWFTSNHAWNTLTVPVILALHMGHFLRDGEHTGQQTMWPQGRNTILASWSMQTLHILASFISLFSSLMCLYSTEKYTQITMNGSKLVVVHSLK